MKKLCFFRFIGCKAKKPYIQERIYSSRIKIAKTIYVVKERKNAKPNNYLGQKIPNLRFNLRSKLIKVKPFKTQYLDTVEYTIPESAPRLNLEAAVSTSYRLRKSVNM